MGSKSNFYYSFSLYVFLSFLNLQQISGISDSRLLKELFLDEVFVKFGQNGNMSGAQFEKFGKVLIGNTDSHLSHSLNFGINNIVVCNGTGIHNCHLNQTCLGASDIFRLFSVNNFLNRTSFTHALPSLIYNLQNTECYSSLIEGHSSASRRKPTQTEAWGYGIGFVCLICLISNVGAFLGPVMKTKLFGRILIFCVALAAGTLAATGLLVLIPESMHLTTEDSPVPDYHWKLTTALGGIYIFFVIERIIRVIVYNRKKSSQLNTEIKVQENGEKKEFIETSHGHSHSHGVDKDGKKTVAPVAWILLFGDALHNFVDGLSIGAAFTENIFTGISVSLAIICEELPHELGDIAVLLHAGLNFKRALFFNFLAAIVCFAGLVIGILVGDTTDGNQWIFGIAGGLFVYIALADMFPEMSQQANLAEKDGSESPGVVFVYQNAGLLCGFLIIQMLVHFGGNLEV